MCVVNAPDIFFLDEDGYNRMAPFDVPPGREAEVRRAVTMCPERALEITDSDA